MKPVRQGQLVEQGTLDQLVSAVKPVQLDQRDQQAKLVILDALDPRATQEKPDQLDQLDAREILDARDKQVKLD